RAAAAARPPSPSTVSVHVVEALRGGRAVLWRALTQPSSAWGMGGGVVSTAAPAAAAVRLLARGSIRARGALPPERCIEPPEMFEQLELRGTTFETRVADEVTA